MPEIVVSYNANCYAINGKVPAIHLRVIKLIKRHHSSTVINLSRTRPNLNKIAYLSYQSWVYIIRFLNTIMS